MRRLTLTLLYFSLSLLTLSTYLQAYDPVDRFTINCGSSGNSSDGERTWTGDTNSKLLSPQHIPTTVTASANTQAPSINQIPYATARLSRSQFNYSFLVTTGPKFIRLFFYPASYQGGFDRGDASFTVESNGFTLLKDFNSSLNADAEGLDTIFREYTINVNDGHRLDLTLTPTTNSSYAFINGIEILSMPSDLYYTAPTDAGFTLVNKESTLYSAVTSTSLETSYRVKIGGRRISPSKDTGLFRNWQGQDESYLRTPSAHDSLPGDTTGEMNITVNPDYAAPEELYRTARDMGPNGVLNKILNLTWEFPVDSGFTYMIRLHFCELDPHITSRGDRAFYIYVAGKVAEERADVMAWTNNQRGIAVYENYAVLIPENDGNQKKVNLSIQMHPYTDGQDTKYSDPFLNGVEIFKISDVATKNLAGHNPDPIQAKPSSKAASTGKKSSSSTTVIGIAAGVASGLVLVFVIICSAVVLRRRKTEASAKAYSDPKSSKCGPLSFTTTKSANSSLPSALCRQFTLAEIRAATGNFDELFIVGVGGFGHVYKGYIDAGSTPVAIKRLKQGSQQGAHEFVNEIDMLSKLRHLHLVSLIGYCNEGNEMILVYDFMARGTLRDHLYNTDNPSLPWKQRLQICIGAARGLHYLHTGAKHTIIHRDVKTTNILLDEKWEAKVSDFGISRIGPTGISKAHVSTVVKGSVGYLDPEYFKWQRLTEKSDVYSFGVVLFEILCARPPLIRTAEKRQVSLVDWARQCYQSGTLGQIVDPALKGRIAPECLRKFGEIGANCLLDNGTHRPSMNDVVWMLEFALQLQESAEQREPVAADFGGDDVEVGKRDDSGDDMFSSGTSVGQVSDYNKYSGVSVSTASTGTYGNESQRLMSGTVFSEIMDPTAC